MIGDVLKKLAEKYSDFTYLTAEQVKQKSRIAWRTHAEDSQQQPKSPNGKPSAGERDQDQPNS